MSARICVTLLGRDYNITREDAEALNRELTAILKSEHQEVIIVHPSPVDSGFDVPLNWRNTTETAIKYLGSHRIQTTSNGDPFTGGV